MKKQRIKKIYSQNKIIAIILRKGEYPKGLKFYNEGTDYLQAGTWHYDQGEKLKAHSHKIFKRTVGRTQEIVYVKTGKIQSNLYDEKDRFLTKIILKPGDTAIYLGGGHDFTILKDHTQIFEVKNGPYLGIEKDKRMITNQDFC